MTLILETCQIILIGVLANAVIEMGKDYTSEELTIRIYAVKFVCGWALHVLVTDNEIHCLEMMKHVTNHPYKFDRPAWSYLAVFI